MKRYSLAKRTLIKFQQYGDDEPLENIEVTVMSDQLVTATAVRSAVQRLLEDLPRFEPPILEANEDDIAIFLGSNAVSPTVTASYQRSDCSTTKVPEGYIVEPGY